MNIKKYSRSAIGVSLFMILSVFNLVIAAAPSEPIEKSPESYIDLTSISAQSIIEQGLIEIMDNVTTTAYSSTKDQTDETPFITALGTPVRHGVVAANFLPFNTKIRMPDIFGETIFEVEDRTHPKYGDRIDIWMPDRESAKQFGIKRVKIQVLGLD